MTGCDNQNPMLNNFGMCFCLCIYLLVGQHASYTCSYNMVLYMHQVCTYLQELLAIPLSSALLCFEFAVTKFVLAVFCTLSASVLWAALKDPSIMTQPSRDTLSRPTHHALPWQTISLTTLDLLLGSETLSPSLVRCRCCLQTQQM